MYVTSVVFTAAYTASLVVSLQNEKLDFGFAGIDDFIVGAIPLSRLGATGGGTNGEWLALNIGNDFKDIQGFNGSSREALFAYPELLGIFMEDVLIPAERQGHCDVQQHGSTVFPQHLTFAVEKDWPYQVFALLVSCKFPSNSFCLWLPTYAVHTF